MESLRYYAACCQTDLPNPRDRKEILRNVERHLALMERAVAGYRPFHDVRLVVFPEFSLAAPIYPTAEELADKLAVPAENEFIDRIANKARELSCWVQTGSFIETDDRYGDALFNTTLLIGPDGLVASRYRKVNPWIPWEVHASPHDIDDYADDPLPVTETEVGKLGVATCYDWLFPEVTRELALKGCEVMIRISAYMDPWGATEPMDWWTVVNRCRALENVAFVVAANQGATQGRYPPFSWPGGSMAVDFDGRILAQAPPGPGEAIVVAPIDVGALRAERRRRSGHAMPAHLRSELYVEQRKPIFPPQSEGRTVERLEESIRRAKGSVWSDGDAP